MSTPQDKARAEAEKEFPAIDTPRTTGGQAANAAQFLRREGFIKGHLRACEHSPDIVDRIMEVFSEAVAIRNGPSRIWGGMGWKVHLTQEQVDYSRTRLTSLFKPQP